MSGVSASCAFAPPGRCCVVLQSMRVMCTLGWGGRPYLLALRAAQCLCVLLRVSFGSFCRCLFRSCLCNLRARLCVAFFAFGVVFVQVAFSATVYAVCSCSCLCALCGVCSRSFLCIVGVVCSSSCLCVWCAVFSCSFLCLDGLFVRAVFSAVGGVLNAILAAFVGWLSASCHGVTSLRRGMDIG